ncbi:MAG: hypothetical protein K9J81_00805 [Desulfohalobiaceae bacterium]|nr:hypothetical protein [Desulfohalobiaceae bacterium]
MIIRFLRKCKSSLDFGWETYKYSGYYRPDGSESSPDLHLAEALDWLKRAQDSGQDRGVSYGARFGGDFLASYPETTGYIIPTFLRLARQTANQDLHKRAEEMGLWEMQIQLACGAVMGGRVDSQPTPAMFNTGQVLLGWSALLADTGDQRFVSAGRRAADWMCAAQKDDGSWDVGNSLFADQQATVYNVKAAWGLGLFGLLVGNEQYVKCACQAAEYALLRQEDNGWFHECCLTDPSKPLLHTLAYTMQGLLELGLLTGNREYLLGVRRTADSLIQILQPSGFLPGRLNRDFSPAVSWCCLTGSAQTAIVLFQLFKLTGQRQYRDAADSLLDYLLARHDIRSDHPSVRGGIPGSWPVNGAYGRFMILNWATKFFIDAMIAKKLIDDPDPRISSHPIDMSRFKPGELGN